MIEKLIETIEAEKAGFVKTESVIRAYRHRLEIELGGVQARRDPEHAENLREQINECLECEKLAAERQQLANEMSEPEFIPSSHVLMSDDAWRIVRRLAREGQTRISHWDPKGDNLTAAEREANEFLNWSIE